MWPIQTKCKAFPSPQTPGFELPSWHAALDANLHVPLYGTQFPSTHSNWFLAEQPRPAKKRKCCPILVCNFSITCVGISRCVVLSWSHAFIRFLVRVDRILAELQLSAVQTGWDKKGSKCLPTGQFRRPAGIFLMKGYFEGPAGGCATHFVYATWRSAIDTILHWIGQGKSWEDVVRKNSASKIYLRRTGSNRLDFTSESHKSGAARAKNVLPQLFSSESSLQSFLPSQSCRGAMHSRDGHKKWIEIHLQLFSSDSSTQLKSPSHRSLLLMQTPLSHWKSSAVHEYPEMIGNNSTMIGMS